MTLRVKVGIALLAAAAVVVAAVWFAMSGQSGGVQADKPASSTAQPAKDSPTTEGSTQPATALTVGEAKQLATNLVSQDAASYRSAWATDTLPPKAPPGTKLVVDAGTFTSQQDAGKVNATITIPGKAPEVWRLLLLRKDSHWAVYTMEEVK